MECHSWAGFRYTSRDGIFRVERKFFIFGFFSGKQKLPVTCLYEVITKFELLLSILKNDF